MTTPDVLWRAYQLGQISADHTDKQVFCEVIGPVLARLAQAETLLRDADSKGHTAMWQRARRAFLTPSDRETARVK